LAGVPYVFETLLDHTTAWTTSRASNASGYWLGTKLQFSVPGVIVGMSYGRWRNDGATAILMLSTIGNEPIRVRAAAKNATSTAGWEGWHEVYFHPYVRIVVGTLYVAWCNWSSDQAVYKANGFTADIVRGHITAPKHNPTTFYQGLQGAGPRAGLGNANCAGTLGAVDVLFKPD
jgi:hypothetical protein